MATVEAYTRAGTDAAIAAAVAAVEAVPGLVGPRGETGPVGPRGETGPVGPRGEAGRDGMTMLTLAAGEKIPEGTPAGTLIVRVIP